MPQAISPAARCKCRANGATWGRTQVIRAYRSGRHGKSGKVALRLLVLILPRPVGFFYKFSSN